MKAGYRPNLLMMGVRERLPPPLRFAVMYSPPRHNSPPIRGCSLQYAADIMHPYAVQDAWFVRSE